MTSTSFGRQGNLLAYESYIIVQVRTSPRYEFSVKTGVRSRRGGEDEGRVEWVRVCGDVVA